jgi:molybdopterin synthase sulfur carrier subunit
MSSNGTISVLIPAPLRRYTGGESKVTGAGSTVAELIDRLEADYPGLRDRIVEEDGEIRRFVNVFVNGQNVRKLQGVGTAVEDGDEVGIVPAMAGGA